MNFVDARELLARMQSPTDGDLVFRLIPKFRFEVVVIKYLSFYHRISQATVDSMLDLAFGGGFPGCQVCFSTTLTPELHEGAGSVIMVQNLILKSPFWIQVR